MLIFSGQCMAADLPVGLGDMMKKMKGVAEQKTTNPSESTQPVQEAELPPPNTIGGYFARSQQKSKIDNDFGGLFTDCVNADADKDSFDAKPQLESYCQSFKSDKRFSNPKDRYATYNHCGQYVSNLRREVKQRQDSCTQTQTQTTSPKSAIANPEQKPQTENVPVKDSANISQEDKSLMANIDATLGSLYQICTQEQYERDQGTLHQAQPTQYCKDTYDKQNKNCRSYYEATYKKAEDKRMSCMDKAQEDAKIKQDEKKKKLREKYGV